MVGAAVAVTCDCSIAWSSSAFEPKVRNSVTSLTPARVFIFSGAAGLIYESIWSRYLGLFVGHSAYAQIIVLVIFLGGMSLGASIVGRRSSALRTPLLRYAGVELLVGILALVFHDAFVAVTARAYESVFPAFTGLTLTVVKWS